jgi:hypothetical protein
MHIQPLDIPALLRAITWPLIVVTAFAIFRRPLAILISLVGQKVSKLSFGKFSIEMAQVPEMKPQAMDAEIRELDAGLTPQSGTTGLTALVNELQSGGKRDYVVIDFGSDTAPRWLSSRLYLLSFLLTLINRQLCLDSLRQWAAFVKSLWASRLRHLCGGLLRTSSAGSSGQLHKLTSNT